MYCVCADAMAPLWRSEDSFWKFVLSFHDMRPRNWTRVVRIGSGHLTHWTTFLFILKHIIKEHPHDLVPVDIDHYISLCSAAKTKYPSLGNI